MFAVRSSAALVAAVMVGGLFIGEVGAEHRHRHKVVEEQPTRVVYSVADLVVPILSSKSCQIELDKARWLAAINNRLDGETIQAPTVTATEPAAKPAPEPAKTLEDQLIRLITTTIAPDTWSEVGGKGSIQYYPLGMALVVNHTPEIQKQIAELLKNLRHCQDLEVAIEIRLVSLSPDMASNFMDLAGFQKLDAKDSKCSVEGAFLNDRQLGGWMETYQGDRKTNVMQAPKITVFNGQTADLNIGDELAFLNTINAVQIGGGQTVFQPQQNRVGYGIRLVATPIIVPDRGGVRVNLSGRYTTDVEVPVEVAVTTEGADGKATTTHQTVTELHTVMLPIEHTVTFADGKTLALRLGKTLEKTHTGAAKVSLADVPLVCDFLTAWESCYVDLSRIPLVGQYFAAAKETTEEQEVFMLVTTRIVINDEADVNELPRIPR